MIIQFSKLQKVPEINFVKADIDILKYGEV